MCWCEGALWWKLLFSILFVEECDLQALSKKEENHKTRKIKLDKPAEMFYYFK
jgi:hypothetical protein